MSAHCTVMSVSCVNGTEEASCDHHLNCLLVSFASTSPILDTCCPHSVFFLKRLIFSNYVLYGDLPAESSTAKAYSKITFMFLALKMDSLARSVFVQLQGHIVFLFVSLRCILCPCLERVCTCVCVYNI